VSWLGWLGWFKRKKKAEVIPLPVRPSRAVLAHMEPFAATKSGLVCPKCKKTWGVLRSYADGKVRCVECADRANARR
jgi:hypothetical protein